MKSVIKNLVALIAIGFLGIGIVNAAPSSDCGDDDVRPIEIHSAITLTNKSA